MFTGASIELKTCNAALLETTGKSWDEVRLLSFPFFFFLFSEINVHLVVISVLYVNVMYMFIVKQSSDYSLDFFLEKRNCWRVSS